jgi:dihydropyrimidinase
MGDERILIRGGAVVAAGGTHTADVAIAHGRVVAVGGDLRDRADRVIDAGGCYVLPGGVDGHVHLENPALGCTRSADDFYTGTLAAATGGTTTIVDFVKREPDASLYESFQRRRARAEAAAVVDFAFHTVVPPSAFSDGSADDLRRLAGEGATSWKFFMAYPGTLMVDDETLSAGIALAAELGVLPVVHAEDGAAVAAATERLVAAGRTGAAEHVNAHEEAAEVTAVRRLAELAEAMCTPILVFHVSSAGAADELRRARELGVPLFGETCPQYLLTAYEDYADLGDDAAAYVCSPPIRPRANQARLWRHLESGVFATIGTDHCPFTLGQPDDLPPQKRLGRGDFRRIPNGVPGVHERMAAIWDAAVATGRISPGDFVELTAAGPARLMGLYPRKGAVAAGSDADIVVWDPEATTTLDAAKMPGRADYSLYDGRRVRGLPRVVMARGEVVALNGRALARRGRGRYLPRRAAVPA